MKVAVESDATSVVLTVIELALLLRITTYLPSAWLEGKVRVCPELELVTKTYLESDVVAKLAELGRVIVTIGRLPDISDICLSWDLMMRVICYEARISVAFSVR